MFLYMDNSNGNFKDFQSLCLNILAQSNNCNESQILFQQAKSVPELVAAWIKFFNGIVHEVPQQVIGAFAELYSVYAREINMAGMFYNEAPRDDSGAIVIVGNCDETIEVHGRARVYVLGMANVVAYDNVVVHCSHNMAVVNLHNHAHATMEDGSCHAHDFSVVNGNGLLFTYDSSTAFISSGVLEDFGHLNITAYNHSVIHSFTKRRIELKDMSVLELRSNL